MRILLPLDGTEKDQRALQVADALAVLSRGEAFRTHVDSGEVAPELLRRAEEMGADVIVLATRAPGTLERAFFGSVADEVVRHAPLPVVVVPPRAIYGTGARISITRVLVPLDGSAASLDIVDRLLDLMPMGSLEYVLMHVTHSERTGGYLLPEPMRRFTISDVAAEGPSGVLHVQAEHAQLHLRELVEQLRENGETATVRVVESGDPAAAIVEAVRDELVDLIAMSTHGAGGLQRLLLGSVANRVVRASEIPVFLVTPRSS